MLFSSRLQAEQKFTAVAALFCSARQLFLKFKSLRLNRRRIRLTVDVPPHLERCSASAKTGNQKSGACDLPNQFAKPRIPAQRRQIGIVLKQGLVLVSQLDRTLQPLER